MKKYIQPSCASIEFSSDMPMALSVFNEGTNETPLSQKRKSGWSSDLWTAEDEE